MIADVGRTWELHHAWPLPSWIILAGSGLLAAVVLGLLWRERISLRQKFALGTLRLIAIAIVVLMLAGWTLLRFETDLPDLVLLVDQSQSMQLPASDSPGSAKVSRIDVVKDLLDSESAMLAELRKEYRLKSFLIGDASQSLEFENAAIGSLEASDSESRLGDLLIDAAEAQRGRATAAIVLLSDGVVTQGASLGTAASLLKSQGIPLWCVAIGSAQQSPNVAINEVFADRRAFVDDQVTVRVSLESVGGGGRQTTLEITDRDSGEVLDSQVVSVGNDPKKQAVRLNITTRKPGRLNLEVRARPLLGEIAKADNARRISILVRDEKMKILLIAQRPSYEFRFLKHLLERATGRGDKNLIDLVSVLQDGDPRYASQDKTAARLPPTAREELESLDLIVLCDANLKQLGSLLQSQIERVVRDLGTGLVVIAGPTNFPESFVDSTLAPLLPIDPANLQTPQDNVSRPLRVALTATGRNTASLLLPGRGTWQNAAPIYWLTAATAIRPTAQILVETPSVKMPSGQAAPVIATQVVGAGQVWLQLTDESFRWISDSQTTESRVPEANIHQHYWIQTARQLATRKQIEDPRSGRLIVSGERFKVGDPIEIRLEPAGGKTLKTAEVSIEDTSGETRTVTLQPLPTAGGSSDRGTLASTISDLAAGNYWAMVQTPSDLRATAPIGFEVLSESLELQKTAAAIGQMQRASERTEGKTLTPEDASRSLADQLPEGRRIKLRQLPEQPIWNHWLLATFLVGVLSCEWWLRRKWGLP